MLWYALLIAVIIFKHDTQMFIKLLNYAINIVAYAIFHWQKLVSIGILYKQVIINPRYITL